MLLGDSRRRFPSLKYVGRHVEDSRFSSPYVYVGRYAELLPYLSYTRVVVSIMNPRFVQEVIRAAQPRHVGTSCCPARVHGRLSILIDDRTRGGREP